MMKPNDMGDASWRPGLSAPEGASIPIAELPKPVAFVDSLEPGGDRGWLNAMAWQWDEMHIPLFTAQQMHAYAAAAVRAPAPMSASNRLVAYSAAYKLRELGYEWDQKSKEWVRAPW